MQVVPRTALVIGILAIVASVTGCARTEADRRSAAIESRGATIFAANCASCHGADGAGGGVGPSLVGERKRKNAAAAIAWIENPAPPMPKLYPLPLSASDVAAVAAYVESR